MGKGWLSCVSCLSSGRDKRNQKSEKKKQESRESIELSLEEDPTVDPSTSYVTHPLPPPPPSDPPLSTSSSIRSYGDPKNRQALALASAVAAEAAVVVAHAAAEVVRLTASSTQQVEEPEWEDAAVKIQTAFRNFKARQNKPLQRGMDRLKTLLQGKYVQRQLNATLSTMQTLTRVQLQIQDRRKRLSEENKARYRQIQQKGHQKEHPQNQNVDKLALAGDFDLSNKSKEQVKATSMNKKEASVRRERALAYAYSHQQTWRNSSKLPHQTLMEQDTPQWGWNWLEKWMASRPWDAQSNDDAASVKSSRTKTSPARSYTLKSASINLRTSAGEGSSRIIKDGESVASTSSRRSYLGNTQTVNDIVTVEATGNLSITQPMKKSKSSVGTSGNLNNRQPMKKYNSSVGNLVNTQAEKKSKAKVGTGNLDNTQAVKKSKVSVGTTSNLGNTQALKSKASVGTISNLDNTQAVKSKVSVGTTSNLGSQKKKVVTDMEKPSETVLAKKRLSTSTSTSLGTTKKLSTVPALT